MVKDDAIQRDIVTKTWSVTNSLVGARMGAQVTMLVVAADEGCDRDIREREPKDGAVRFYVLPTGCTKLARRIVKIAQPPL
jgi:hypothetical protein